MDRSVLESDPQRVLEGMTIAAYAVGASKGYFYVRAEYPLAVARLTNCLRDARRRGLLATTSATRPSASTPKSVSARSLCVRRGNRSHRVH